MRHAYTNSKSISIVNRERESMTRTEAKRELKPIKDLEKDIRSVELEFE